MGRALLVGGIVVLVLLVVSQVVLPELAERRVRDDLATIGAVETVDVEAFPAPKLLFGRADAVRARLSRVRTGGRRLGDLLERAEHVDRLDVRAPTGRVGTLDVSDALVRKRGDDIELTATATRQALQAAVPGDFDVDVVGARRGALQLRVAAGPVEVDAQAAARNGALVVAADGLLGALGSFTVFRHPAIRVTGVTARPQDGGFRFAVRGVSVDPA